MKSQALKRPTDPLKPRSTDRYLMCLSIDLRFACLSYTFFSFPNRLKVFNHRWNFGHCQSSHILKTSASDSFWKFHRLWCFIHICTHNGCNSFTNFIMNFYKKDKWSCIVWQELCIIGVSAWYSKLTLNERWICIDPAISI